jgi:hypothetical protein
MSGVGASDRGGGEAGDTARVFCRRCTLMHTDNSVPNEVRLAPCGPYLIGAKASKAAALICGIRGNLWLKNLSSQNPSDSATANCDPTKSSRSRAAVRLGVSQQRPCDHGGPYNTRRRKYRLFTPWWPGLSRPSLTHTNLRTMQSRSATIPWKSHAMTELATPSVRQQLRPLV